MSVVIPPSTAGMDPIGGFPLSDTGLAVVDTDDLPLFQLRQVERMVVRHRGNSERT